MGKSKDNIAVTKESQPVLEKIYDILQNIISIKSLWMFRHVPQIQSFKSWGYYAKDRDLNKVYKQRAKQVDNQIIPEALGSIGSVFRKEYYHKDWLYEGNTYKAPEGTVVELDLILRHQSVLFVPFKVEKEIIAILLLSTKPFAEEEKAKIQKRIDKAFKTSGIYDLVQLAYRNERNKDVIANVKKATLDAVSINITSKDSSYTTLQDNTNITPEFFVQNYLINPIKEFNQGTSFVPIIEIEDKQHLQKSQWGYSDVVYDKLRKKLRDYVKKPEILSDGNPVKVFVDKCDGENKFDVDLGEGCSITYVLRGGADVFEDMVHNANEVFKVDVEELLKKLLNQKTIFDPDTLRTIKKKYISERLNQFYNKDERSHFYLVLEKSEYFEKELITSNLDAKLHLDAYRKQLTAKNNLYYNHQPQEYSSTIIDGLVFRVYTDTDKKYGIEEIFNEDVKAFIDQRCLYYKLLLDQKQAKKDAVRAAIAQVMARNMSHNFGSHVYSRLIDDKVYKDLQDEVVKADLKNYSPLFDNKEVFKEKEDHQLQFFFQYQKSRMDYLSEITFGVPNLITTKMMYGDVMKELDRVRILLNYISGVSGFKYKFDLKYNYKSLKNNDIGLAFPSDVLGCHAFYNIIENIIRNTAKHAGKKNMGNGSITFTIHFKDIKGCDGVEGVDELYCVEIDNGVREDGIEELVTQQNKRFNKSVLENNKLRSSSLGLLEMEASAAFLRQIDMPEIESDDYEVNEEKDVYFHEQPNGTKLLNIIRAFAIAVKDEGKKNEKGEPVKTGRLGYRFFVQKPKEFLVMGKSVDKNTEKQLLNYGIQFISKDGFIKAMEDEKSFAHQFLLYAANEDISAEIDQKYDSDYKTLLPLRKLPINNKDWETISGFWSNLNSGTPKNGKTKQDKKPNNKPILQQLKEWAWEKYAGSIAEGLTADTVCVKGQASNKDYQVVLIDHGELYKDEWEAIQTRKFNTKEGWVENMSSRTNGKLPRFEALSKTGKGAKPIQKYLDQLSVYHPENGYIRIELFEAYHNKVVVIDERVQKFAAENFEGDGGIISCADLHRSTNVFIPKLPPKNSSTESQDPDMIPLDPNDFGEYVKKVEDYIDKNIKDSFLLIHYGILERMYGRDETSITAKLKEWAIPAKRVVVTSGRGAHSLNLPKSVCFVNLSSVLYVFNENRNKYIINYLLNQSRRKRNE